MDEAAGRGGRAGPNPLALSVSVLREPPPLSPVVIAGGGLAGASAACLLARAGRRVTVLERDRGPQHKICGEFISGEAIGYLRSLGVDAMALGAAPVTEVRLVHRGRTAQARLPFAAAGLSRYALDEALLRRAAALGAEVHRGVRVRSAGAGRVLTESGALAAPTLLLATGKQDLRGLAREPKHQPEGMIGVKVHLRLAPAQRAAVHGSVEVVLFEGGYGGLQMIEHDTANLCVLIDREVLTGGVDWPALAPVLAALDPHLACRLEGAEPCDHRPLSIFRVPYGFVHDGDDLDGVFRLGDQAAVIPSFCGDGMAIAVHSAHLAAETVLRGGGAAAYHRLMRRDAGPPVRLAYGLYRMGRSAAMRGLVVEAARVWPGLLRVVARRTRVAAPSTAARRSGPIAS